MALRTGEPNYLTVTPMPRVVRPQLLPHQLIGGSLSILHS
jgi:hypothetical protein